MACEDDDLPTDESQSLSQHVAPLPPTMLSPLACNTQQPTNDGGVGNLNKKPKPNTHMNTILVEEYTSETPPSLIQQLAEDGETLMMLESLGLTGQQSLYKSADPEELIKPHPYRQITAEELVVFQENFPNKTEVKKYKQCPIPLRVLQIISHVQSLNNPDMAYLQVWSPNPGVVDPILVARKNDWQSPIYLLARWGSSLTPFNELREKAIQILTAKAKATLTEARDSIESALKNLETKVRAKVLSGESYSPYVQV